MGSSASKPSPHVWKGPHPTGVSQDIVDRFQSSTETNGSRAQILELQIQARVAKELRKLQAEENEALKKAQEELLEPSEKDSSERLSRHSVSNEVAALRARLDEERRKVREMPEEVETARSEVVRCLRENDRRPLDCWMEVANFKERVRALEKGWVDKVSS